MNKGNILKVVISASVMAALLAMSAPAAVVVLKDGKQVQGSQVRVKSDGSVSIITAQGNLTYAKGQYIKVVADKPANFDELMKQVAAGQGAAAIAPLKQLILDNRGMGWDDQGRILLGKVYYTQGKYADAITVYEELFKSNPEAQNKPDIQSAYREALMKAGDTGKLTGSLDSAIKSGNREEAARAQMQRGDMKMSRGQTEEAVMDYLRTALLFRDVPATQPEALYKAAEGLTQLRDPRAKNLYQDIVDSFPDSEYAAQARTKI